MQACEASPDLWSTAGSALSMRLSSLRPFGSWWALDHHRAIVGNRAQTSGRGSNEARVEYAAGFVLALSIFVGFAGSEGAASTKRSRFIPPRPLQRGSGSSLLQPANVATYKFAIAAGSWSSSTTHSQEEAAAQPVIRAFEKVDHGLITDQWPSAARLDLNAVAAADAALIGDLEGLSHVNLLSSTWKSNYQRVVSHLSAAVAIVRHDLGLPSSPAR